MNWVVVYGQAELLCIETGARVSSREDGTTTWRMGTDQHHLAISFEKLKRQLTDRKSFIQEKEDYVPHSKQIPG